MKNRAQRGMTLLETIVALALASLLLVGLTTMIETSLADAKGQQAALQQEQMVAAARRHIAANYATLLADTAGGVVVAVTQADLAAAGFLPEGAAAVNAYSQPACVLVRQSVAGKLDALVATYGGKAIPDRDLPLVAMLAGQGGGYVSAAAPGTARGIGWELATTAYRNVACGASTVLTGGAGDGGHLVSSLFYDGPGQQPTDFLYRSAVPGRPELNQMNEPLTMANNALVAPGAACGDKAAIGVEESSRSLLVCGKDGLWQKPSNWKEPVAAYANLPASGNTLGDVRVVTDLSRAFTYGAKGWTALAVDQKGNLDVDGTLSTGAIAAKGAIVTQDAIIAQGKISGVGGVEGNWVKGLYWLEGPSLYINAPIAPGTACNYADGAGGIIWAIGTISHDGNGHLLACMAPENVFKYQNGTLTP